MTTPATLPHVDAITMALEAAGLTVYLGGTPPGVAPTATEPFIVLFPGPARPIAASLGDNRTDFEGVLQLTCVGLTADQAVSVQDRAVAVLAGAPVIAGRVSWKPEPLDDQPVQRDDDVIPPNYYAVARYRLRSVPQ